MARPVSGAVAKPRRGAVAHGRRPGSRDAASATAGVPWAQSTSGRTRWCSSARSTSAGGSSSTASGSSVDTSTSRGSGSWSGGPRARCSVATPTRSGSDSAAALLDIRASGAAGIRSTPASPRPGSTKCSTTSPGCPSTCSRSTTGGNAPSASGTRTIGSPRAWRRSRRGSETLASSRVCGSRRSSPAPTQASSSDIPRCWLVTTVATRCSQATTGVARASRRPHPSLSPRAGRGDGGAGGQRGLHVPQARLPVRGGAAGSATRRHSA